MIDAAENEFNLYIEEEIQRRIKEQEAYDQQDKMRKSPKLRKQRDETGEESDMEDLNGKDPEANGAENGHKDSNGTSNGHHHENGQAENGNGAIKHEA